MIPPLRPSFRILSETLAGAIIDEAYEVLKEVGVYVESDEACAVFARGGACPGASADTVSPGTLRSAVLHPRRGA